MVDDQNVDVEGLPEPTGMAVPPTVSDLPKGYTYRVTRYADLILKHALPERFQELVSVLDGFQIGLRTEILKGGGARATHTARFDAGLEAFGWGKRTISVSRLIDDKMIHATRGHEIDMFGAGDSEHEYPGVAVEMEWNNKDPFFDRDLLNFMALHREGALAVGVVVTRGPRLQEMLGPVVKTSANQSSKKYGTSTTHWDKLIPRINLGGGGECPLLLIGIEPERVDGVEELEAAYRDGRILW